MAERTLVASATNLVARGFLVVPTDRRGRDGAPVNGLFAVARGIARAIGARPPTRAVAVVDSAAAALPLPDLLRPQLAPLPDLLRALGLTVVEAPDEVHLVASYAQAARAAGDDVVIVGVDKRFAQLVGVGVAWYDANKDARYTPEVVRKRFGVGPSQVAEWLALVGDEAALPGIAGIGAKGATGLLEAHGSVEGALATLDTIGGRLGNALRAAAGDALPRELARARLETTRPLPVALGALGYAPDVASRNALFERLGFVELLVAGEADVTAELCADDLAVREALARMGSGLVAVHAVIDDEERGALVGIALASVASPAIEPAYVPFGGGGWPALVTWLEDANAPKLAHDWVGTLVALARAGVRVAGVTADSACASHLTEPSNWAPHDLPIVAKLALGRALPTEASIRGDGKKARPWSALPPEKVAAAAALFATTTAELWTQLAPGVERVLLDEYLALTDVLVRMELTGLRVDKDELGRAEAAFGEMEAELSVEIERHAGHPFNINSTKQLGAVLFDELKLPVVGHTKTGWSTANESLERIEHAHPIVALVIRWRMLRRLRDAWIGVLRRCIDPADGRVHARFHPARSFSGHLVSTNPDLVRVPGRTPEMARIRRAFVAAPGRVLMSVDYQQLGLYVLAHLTGDPALVEPLRRREDLHRLTAAAVLDKAPEAITPDERQLGKVVNFATFAGQGASALALQLGVPAAEAKQIIARFDRRYAKVREFQERQFALVKERGFITTLAGRRWPIGGLESLDPMLRSYAERLARRATHEGSVADVARRALLDADRALRNAGLDAVPVHEIVDEVLFDVREDQLAEVARVAAEAMRNAWALTAPLVVGVEAGRTWADIEPVGV